MMFGSTSYVTLIGINSNLNFKFKIHEKTLGDLMASVCVRRVVTICQRGSIIALKKIPSSHVFFSLAEFFNQPTGPLSLYTQNLIFELDLIH